MKYLLKVAFMTVIVLSVVFQIGISELRSQTITAEDIYEEYIYKDYVVEGTILSTMHKKILHEEFNPYTNHPSLIGKKVRIIQIGLKIINVLIGDLDINTLVLVGNDGCLYSGGKTRELFGLEIGDTIIIPLRDINKGIYKSEEKLLITGWDSSRFVIKGNTFLRGKKNNPIQKGKTKDLYRAIGEIRKKRSIESITAQAEVIARGKIKSKWTTKDTLSSGFSKNIVRMKLEIDDCFKGDTGSDELEFSVVYRPYYEPFWRAEVPHVNVGEDWLVFLKWAEEPGYYPFAGVNGMFKIEDDKLIRDNRIVMKKKIQDVKTIIMQEMSGGGEDAK